MSSDMNSVSLIGRLTRNIELSYTQGGSAIGKMSVAVGRRYKSGDQYVEYTSFFDVTLFGKIAESLQNYLVKGKQVAIDGSLRQDRWERDGRNFSRVLIVADNVQLLGGSDRKPGSSGVPSQVREFSDAMDGEVMGDDDGFPEDIPF